MITLFKEYMDNLNKENIDMNYDTIINILNIVNGKIKEFTDNIFTAKNIKTLKIFISNDARRFKDFQEIENAFSLYLKTFRIRDTQFVDHFNKLLNDQIESDINYLNRNINDIFNPDMSRENIRVKEVFVFMYLTNILKVFDIIETFILALNTKTESLPGVIYEDMMAARGSFNFLLEIKNKDIKQHLKMLDREKLSDIIIDKDIDDNIYKLADKRLNNNRAQLISSGVVPFSNFILTMLARFSSTSYAFIDSKKSWVKKKIEILEYENMHGSDPSTQKNDLLELITAYKNRYLRFLEMQERWKK